MTWAPVIARLTVMADAAPVLIWVAGLDKKCTYFNRTWLEFTGRTLEQEAGDGWVEGVHPDDVSACMGRYVEAFEARRPFRMEYRLRRHDGEYRWIIDHGTPRFGPDGGFAGYIGSCFDITEMRLAEDRLRLQGAAGLVDYRQRHLRARAGRQQNRKGYNQQGVFQSNVLGNRHL